MKIVTTPRVLVLLLFVSFLMLTACGGSGGNDEISSDGDQPGADEDQNTDGDLAGDRDENPDGDKDEDLTPADKDEDPDSDGDVEPDTDGDSDSDEDPDSDGDVEPDTDGDTDGDVEPDTDGDTDGDVEPDTDGDEDGDVEPEDEVEAEEELEVESESEWPQVCAKATDQISCGESIDGNNENSPSEWNIYSCLPQDFELNGKEDLYHFDSLCDGTIWINLSSNNVDLDLLVLSDCSADSCVAFSADIMDESIELQVEAGTRYYIVVDGVDEYDYGDYSLSVSCTCIDCKDNDDDTYFGYHPYSCPTGDDCNDGNGSINPGMQEVECDGLDNDCSNGDLCQYYVCVDNDEDGFYLYDADSCPMGKDCNDEITEINPDATEVECDDIDQNCDGHDLCAGSGQACDSCFPLVGGCATGFSCTGYFDDMMFFCAMNCGDTGVCPDDTTCRYDYLAEDYVCWPDQSASCQGSTLYKEDSCGNDLGHMDCGSATCNAEAGVCESACNVIESSISCDQTINANNSAGENQFEEYNCLKEENGPELIYSYQASCDGSVIAKLDILTDDDLDLVILEDTCSNGNCIAVASSSDQQEQVAFNVTNGEDYYIVVDGYNNGAGWFDLSLECICDNEKLPHCSICENDSQCADGATCLSYGSPSTEGVKVCAADCSADGTCPANSHCEETGDFAFHCIPDLTANCQDAELHVDDACGNSFLWDTCESAALCDASALECKSLCVDEDEDGYFAYDANDCPSGDDCNDDNNDINPGAEEILCNSEDEDCNGQDDCPTATQCEPCENGHCSAGHYCYSWPGDEEYQFCLADCTDSECSEAWELICTDFISGTGDGPFYCRPKRSITCDGNTFTESDTCNHILDTADCDFDCWNDFGCVNGCDTETSITCGDLVSGDTSSAESRTTYYYNSEDTIDDLTGPELSYKFTTSCDGEFSAQIGSNSNLYLIVLESRSDGSCRSNKLVTSAWGGSPIATWIATSGSTYYLIVEGYDGAKGNFDLQINCFCGNCVDTDEDSFFGYDPVNCPTGTDCNDDNPDINPDATEIQCDDIDQDCDGFDLCESPVCDVDEEISCGASVSGNNYGQTNDIDFYTGDCNNTYAETSGEYIYHLTADCDGMLRAEFTSLSNDDLGMYILGDSCNGASCLSKGWYDAEAQVTDGEDYYIVADGLYGSTGSWDLSVDCTCFETCAAYASINNASGTVSGNVSSQPNQMSIYSCTGYEIEGGEYIFDYTADCSGEVTLTLSGYDSSWYDLEILVLEGSCMAGNCIMYGDEEATFDAVSGKTYFIVIDDFYDDASTFDLTLSSSCATK